jgi:hypothetical protein
VFTAEYLPAVHDDATRTPEVLHQHQNSSLVDFLGTNPDGFDRSDSLWMRISLTPSPDIFVKCIGIKTLLTPQKFRVMPLLSWRHDNRRVAFG